MNYIKQLKHRFNHDEFCVIFSVLCLSLPYYLCGPLLVMELLYLLYTKKLVSAFKNTPKSKYLLLFILLISIVSFIHQNWLGLFCSGVLLCVISLLMFYYQVITKDLFEFIIDLLIVCSVLWAIYGLYEYMLILRRHGYDHFVFKFFSNRKDRPNNAFMNANYYAMMIEFILLSIVYKIFTTKNIKRIICYILIAMLNGFLLLLTACRTAWPAIAIGCILFLIINRNYKWCAFIGGCAVTAIIVIIIKPSLFPRVDSIIDYYYTRKNIWETAVKGIQAHPIFGQGPMTYMMIYKQYHGHVTEHAHSLYLDPFLCFGISGVMLIIIYIIDNLKRLFYVAKHNLDCSYVALTIACVAAVMIHGLVDYTIFFPHTAIFFLYIASAFSMYTRNQKDL